jgi:hypothetical protein
MTTTPPPATDRVRHSQYRPKPPPPAPPVQVYRLSFGDFLEASCRLADMCYGSYPEFRWPSACRCSNYCGPRHGLCEPCQAAYSIGERCIGAA